MTAVVFFAEQELLNKVIYYKVFRACLADHAHKVMFVRECPVCGSKDGFKCESGAEMLISVKTEMLTDMQKLSQ